MDQQKVAEKARGVTLTPQFPTNHQFLLIHGYTGSPTDFNNLPNILHAHFGAHVSVPLLRGHGTRVDDLDDLEYQHFFEQIEEVLKKFLADGRQVVVGGNSFGAYVALHLAAKHPVAGVLAISVPYTLRFPFNIRILAKAARFLGRWEKKFTPEERALRSGAYYYEHMHGNGLGLLHSGNRMLDLECAQITKPCFVVHASGDPLGLDESVRHILENVRSKVKGSYITQSNGHQVLYGEGFHEAEKQIVDFFDSAHVFTESL